MKKQHARKASRPSRPSRLDALTATVAQDWAHANTATINARQRVLQFEAEELDKSIVALAGAQANARERRAKIEAMLAGLAAVVEKR
ncbi:MAG: hypothetical protein NUV51_04535 [Sulfuricaulis sp.]|nr:hypothetical protein [Sulfuricaulis sp.]